MKKPLKKASFEIEKCNGETFFAFEVTVFEDGEIEITKEKDCSLADVDDDCIFGTENKLYRMQRD